jgi:tetratricopeptide (TPR) repeat protein
MGCCSVPFTSQGDIMKKLFFFSSLVLSLALLEGKPLFDQSRGADPQEPEAMSLLGKPLYRMNLSAEQKAQLEKNLAEARADYDKRPRDPDNIIWLGRRLAYLWRYRDAVDVFTRGIVLHPTNAKLYRHRGHRYITLREFDKAISDLEKAADLIAGTPDEIEPDGAPNPAGKPRSTLHSNIWYHLGLAYYLKGDFANARRCYEACMKVSMVNDDMLVATADWLYMTYRRMGLGAEARELLELVRENMDILENHAYHKRLLMYKGLVNPESLLDPGNLTELDLLTQGYGVANWYFVNGEKGRAKGLLEKILQGSYWAAFGYIAAEADLSRWQE